MNEAPLRVHTGRSKKSGKMRKLQMSLHHEYIVLLFYIDVGVFFVKMHSFAF